MRVAGSWLAYRWLLALWLCTGPGLAHTQPAAEGARAVPEVRRAELLALGQRIYRDGVRASGESMVASGAAQTRLAGADAACATCHRRSGYGTTEGRFAIRPITGPALQGLQELPVRSPRIRARVGTVQREPYTEALLARAVRSGVDSSGKPLDAVMPRYTLSDDEMAALSAYLFSLSSLPSPGVDARDIHFATVIQPGVSTERRRAMLEVMQAFVKDKDANARLDEQRREAGNMRMYRSYRKWVLHTWELTGPSDTWAAQLEALYRQQPVFALIGGLGDASWRPIHEFSERLEVPCVFPIVDQPVLTGANTYTFYLSRGVALEAEVLAKYLRDQGQSGKVLQVYRRDEGGAVAAAALRAAWSPAAGATLDDKVLDGAASEVFWRDLAAAGASAVVLWLGPRDLAQGRPGIAPALYLSSSLLAGSVPQSLLGQGSPDVRLVHSSDLPPKRDARLLRAKLWLHNKGIALTDEAVQINTQFTLTIASDVLGHLMDSFSRDFFVERIEHVVGQTPSPSTYQSVSLGPGQRFAAKGGAIAQLVDADPKQLKALSGWIVP